MFGLIMFVMFGFLSFSNYKRGLVSKNRFIGSMVMMFIGLFLLPFLVPVIGLILTLVLCFINAFWTPSVISNALDDMNKK